MAKKTGNVEWNNWMVSPQDGEHIIMRVDGTDTDAQFFSNNGERYVVIDGKEFPIVISADASWKLKPADPVQTETKANEIERLDTKRIPDETARRWIARMILEEYGTVADDLQLNTDKLIAYYNAGFVKK